MNDLGQWRFSKKQLRRGSYTCNNNIQSVRSLDEVVDGRGYKILVDKHKQLLYC
jgi:hypothetical protein